MSRPGFSFLVCPDSRLVQERIEELLAEHGASDFERRVYFGDEEPPQTFWQDLSGPGLLGGARAVVLRRAEGRPDAFWKELSPRLAGFNDAVWPFFCLEGAGDRKGPPKPPAVLAKQKYWPVAEKRGWVWSSPGVTSNTLPGLLKSGLARRGLNAPPHIFRELAGALPLDAAAVENELDKLALAAPDGQLGPEHARLVAHVEQTDFWSLLAALQEGRFDPEVWRAALAGDEDGLLFKLLSSLQREVRALWMILAGEERELRMPDWMLRKKEPLARRVTPRTLARVWGLLLEAELAVKSGEKKEDQALELLVAGLARAFAGARPAAGGRYGAPGR